MFFKYFFLLFVIALFSEQSQADDVAFIKFGSYNAGNSDVQAKAYYIPRYFKSFWVDTRSICKAYGMDVLSLDTKKEMDSFLGLCQANAFLFETYTHIGGMTLAAKSATSWYWVNSGNYINYKLKFGVGEPNNSGSNEYCMGMLKLNDKTFVINDTRCSDFSANFVCQKFE